jgi:hypothetical protein
MRRRFIRPTSPATRPTAPRPTRAPKLASFGNFHNWPVHRPPGRARIVCLDFSGDRLLRTLCVYGKGQRLVKRRLIIMRRHAAPVDGTVQQLGVHTVGGVVTPAQALLIVVPADSRLEIEAMVPKPRHRLRPSRPERRDQDRHLQLHPLRPAARRGARRVAGRHHPRQAAGQIGRERAGRRPRAIRASPRARRWSTPRASPSTGRRCRLKTGWSSSRRAWR